MGQHGLIAIMSMDEVPVQPQNISNMTYSKSSLAINEFDRLVQVYVTADNNSGLNDFLDDYPNAEVQEDMELDLEKWKLLAFPSEVADNLTPLEIFFKGRIKENVQEAENNQ